MTAEKAARRGPPDFVIAGAPRCGTTSLYVHLDRHPDVCMATVKEPGFFSPDLHSKHSAIRGRQTTQAWYERLWERCPAGSLRGEASTAYFSDRASAGLLRAAAPEAKVVIMLRDPVVRIHSQYLHDLRARRLPALDDMIDADHPRLRSYVDVSRYSGHVQRYRDTFPPDQLHIILLEDLSTDPVETFGGVMSFLGIETSYVPAGIDVPFNESATMRSRLLDWIFAWRPLPWTTFNAGLRNVVAVVHRLNARPVSSEPDPALRRRLLPMLVDDVERLEEMLGRPLEDWKSERTEN